MRKIDETTIPFLENEGYGKGTNFTLNLVDSLMLSYAESLTEKPEPREDELKCLTYETKCRICGEITSWAFGGDNSDEEWLKIHAYVFEHMTHPSTCRCHKCSKETIQDYVSYDERYKYGK